MIQNDPANIRDTDIPDIMQVYILQCLQVAREMQESQLQNVPTCYKQIRENMNKQEQTNDISS